MAAVTGGVLANCRASDITAPSFHHEASKPTSAPLRPDGQAPNLNATVLKEDEIFLDVPSAVTNTCNGDVVALQSKIRMSYQTTRSESGNIHVRTDDRMTGNGTALTGTEYTVDSRSFEEWETAAPYPYEHTIIKKDLYNSKGTEPNFLMHSTVHTTVNSLGIMTAVVTNVKTECKG